MRLLTIITGLAASAMLLTGVVLSALTVPAQANGRVTVSAPVSDAQVEALLVRLVSGKAPRKSDARTVAFVLDSTMRYALHKDCGFDRKGNRISERGEWLEAHLYGQTKSDIGNASTQQSARLKLSYHNGLCYLKVSGKGAYPQTAYQGAVRRTALALSKMRDRVIQLSDTNGKVLGVYRWSNKW